MRNSKLSGGPSPFPFELGLSGSCLGPLVTSYSLKLARDRAEMRRLDCRRLPPKRLMNFDETSRWRLQTGSRGHQLTTSSTVLMGFTCARRSVTRWYVWKPTFYFCHWAEETITKDDMRRVHRCSANVELLLARTLLHTKRSPRCTGTTLKNSLRPCYASPFAAPSVAPNRKSTPSSASMPMLEVTML